MEHSISWWSWRILAIVVVLAVSTLLTFRYTKSTSRLFRKLIEHHLAEIPAGGSELIDEQDLTDLPGPVRKYLEYVGVLGTEKVNRFSVRIDGEFRMSRDRDWAPVTAQQMSVMGNLTRLFLMEMKFMGMKITGFHHYESASASMVIKILDLFTVADAHGEEMNRGETVTLFNDMCILAPSALIDPRIRWRLIDDRSVEGIFTNEGLSVKAILYFNDQGQLIDFVSDDRYYRNDDDTYDLIPWSTPIIEYGEINGLKLPTYAEAVWMLESGPYTYAKFNIRDVTINPSP